jgi:hypothetical protein
LSKEKELEDWAAGAGVELTSEMYLENQRLLILQQLSIVGIELNLPGNFIASLNSRQFAEVLAGLFSRIKKH